MFEILDRTGIVVTTASSRPEALRVQTRLEFCTLQPHHLRLAKVAAASSLARAYEAGTVVWDGDMPVAV